jgi:hypothetical protein
VVEQVEVEEEENEVQNALEEPVRASLVQLPMTGSKKLGNFEQWCR